jgi:hypothetical protein
MRARVIRVVIVIVETMGLHGRRGNKVMGMGMGMGMEMVTTMVMGREVGRERVERGARMRMRRCLSLRAGVQRVKDKI